jgi:glycosyltransferase involved in cell wall biosynthesis
VFRGQEKMAVSIIIPAYNVARWLPATLDSLLRQTFSDWEAIIVDDGSTDDTAGVVEDYRARDNRLCLIRTPHNFGTAAARNLGMLQSRGEYIAFLDADDIWLPAKLEKQQQLLAARSDCEACYTQFELVDDFCEITDGWRELSRIFSHNPVNAFALARGNYIGGSASGVLMRRSLIKTVGLFNETMRGSEDLDYWYRIALRGQFCLVPEVLVKIRRRSETRISSAERNLHGALDFVRNARFIAPKYHLRMLSELEIEARLMLWSLQFFRKVGMAPLLFLLGRQHQPLRRAIKSFISLGGWKNNPAFREQTSFQSEG